MINIDMKQTYNHFALLCMLLSLVACESLPFMDNTPDYKNAGRARPLEVPPDLTAIPTRDSFSVPGATSYSTYAQNKQNSNANKALLISPDGIRLEKSGGQRWLVVNAAPSKVWPLVREFWTDLGFAVRVENLQTGVMETEWVDADKLQKSTAEVGALTKFDQWLDRVSGFADKRKFRTRLEVGENNNSTEIYLTHRSVTGAPDDGKNRVKTTLGEIDTGYRSNANNEPSRTTANDLELDAELLRRLMIKLGVAEQQSKALLANAERNLNAKAVRASDGSASLTLVDDFDRAWRRVALALDRLGFVTEDKDRSQGLFFVRYADTNIDDAPEKPKSFLDKLKFWKSDVPQDKSEQQDKDTVSQLKSWGKSDPKYNQERQYRIRVKASDSGSLVAVVNAQGQAIPTITANRILALLYEQLR